MLTIIVATASIALLLLVLGSIIRFSVVGAWRTRGANHEGRIMFHAPGRERADIVVAPSAEALSRFEVATGEL